VVNPEDNFRYLFRLSLNACVCSSPLVPNQRLVSLYMPDTHLPIERILCPFSHPKGIIGTDVATFVAVLNAASVYLLAIADQDSDITLTSHQRSNSVNTVIIKLVNVLAAASFVPSGKIAPSIVTQLLISSIFIEDFLSTLS